jgi:hypothetical protein
MVWMTGLKDSPFYPLLYSPRAPTDILTVKKWRCFWKVSPSTLTEWPHGWRTIQGSVWPQGTDTQTSFWGRSIVTLTSAALELTDMKCVTKVTVFYWLTGSVSMSMSSSTLTAVLISPSFAMYWRVYLLKSQLKDQKHDKMFNWSVHYHYPVSRWYIAVWEVVPFIAPKHSWVSAHKMKHKIISVPVHKTLRVFYIRCMKTYHAEPGHVHHSIIFIIITNIQGWAIWPVPSPELKLLSPSFLWSLSLWAIKVWF